MSIDGSYDFTHFPSFVEFFCAKVVVVTVNEGFLDIDAASRNLRLVYNT